MDIRPEPIVGKNETDEDILNAPQEVEEDGEEEPTTLANSGLVKEEKPNLFGLPSWMLWVIGLILVFVVILMVVLGLRVV